MKVILAVLTCTAAAALIGCDDAKSQPPAAQAAVAPVAVHMAHPKRGAISRWVQLPGNVRAFQQATLYAKTAGYLKVLTVDYGDRVKAGDLIAEIESPELIADVAKFKAEIDVAQSNLKRLAEAQQKAPDLVTPLAVDEARGKLDVARANFERNQTLIGFARITAPFNGVITRRWVDPGALIPAATSGGSGQNAAIVTVMDFSAVRVDVPVPEAEVPLVRTGLVARISMEEFPNRAFDGRVTRFAYALDEETKTMLTEIQIANPDGVLRPGMFASCRIAVETKPDALLIPAAAVVTEKAKTSVFKVVDGKARKMAVKVGFREDASVEILDGISPDETLVLAGGQGLNDGQPVRVIEAQ